MGLEGMRVDSISSTLMSLKIVACHPNALLRKRCRFAVLGLGVSAVGAESTGWWKHLGLDSQVLTSRPRGTLLSKGSRMIRF